METIGLVLLTLNAQKHFERCLRPHLKSRLRPKILIIDSSSDDQTMALAKKFNIEAVQIARHEFNHGATRELARKKLGTDIVVMLTQDAYAVDEFALEKLCEPLLSQNASIAYGRQIPHHGADFFEAFHRAFNYPAQGHIRSIQDQKEYGKYTFFCSNSFAAYRTDALDSIGGFPTLLFGEDTAVTASLLRKGHKIAYVADAVVHHSHNYSLLEEFRRHFDIGYVRQMLAGLLACDESDSKRGASYVKEMMAELLAKRPTAIPYAMIYIAMKWFGYTCGRYAKPLPNVCKRFLSSCPGYFRS